MRLWFRKKEEYLAKFVVGKSCLDYDGEYYRNGNGDILFGYEALEKFLQMCSPADKILDIGCGKKQNHAAIMRENGLNPLTCDFFENCDYRGFYENISFSEGEFDAIWCNHVLEHTLNPHNFLNKIYHDIKEDGILALTVPPLKQNIVGGHVNLFNSGLLLYRMILAGFDCSGAKIWKYGYNISIVMKVKKIKELPELKYDAGDIEALSCYFPFQAGQGFDGDRLTIL